MEESALRVMLPSFGSLALKIPGIVTPIDGLYLPSTLFESITDTPGAAEIPPGALLLFTPIREKTPRSEEKGVSDALIL